MSDATKTHITQPASSTAPKLTQDQLVKLRDLEQELHDLIKRKKGIDKSLNGIEVDIFNAESHYLEDTRQGGNVVKGFDGYLNARVAAPIFHHGSSTGQTKSNIRPTDRDRIFSHSSTTFLKVCFFFGMLLIISV